MTAVNSGASSRRDAAYRSYLTDTQTHEIMTMTTLQTRNPGLNPRGETR